MADDNLYQCVATSEPLPDGQWRHECVQCHKLRVCRSEKLRWACGLGIYQHPLGQGAGTILAKMFAALGKKSCGQCHRLADAMDRMGAKWCWENRDKIIREIKGRANVVERVVVTPAVYTAIQIAKVREKRPK